MVMRKLQAFVSYQKFNFHEVKWEDKAINHTFKVSSMVLQRYEIALGMEWDEMGRGVVEWRWRDSSTSMEEANRSIHFTKQKSIT